MQSVQESSLAFLLIDPFLICDDFEADIDDKELADMKKSCDGLVEKLKESVEGASKLKSENERLRKLLASPYRRTAALLRRISRDRSSLTGRTMNACRLC